MNNHLLSTCNDHVTLGEEVLEAVQIAGNRWGERTAESIEACFLAGRRGRQLGVVLCHPVLAQPLDNIGPDWP